MALFLYSSPACILGNTIIMLFLFFLFAGFSFGGSLAMAVHAELWSQSCLRIDDLKANVACIGFGVPLFSLAIVKQIAEDCPDIIDNTHLFYIQNDVFPCVLQCVDFPKPKEKSKKSSRKNEVI